MYRSEYDWQNYLTPEDERQSYEDWLFNEQLQQDYQRMLQAEEMKDYIRRGAIRSYGKRRYDIGGGIEAAGDLTNDIMSDWQEVKNSEKKAEQAIDASGLGNKAALSAVTSGNLYDTSSVDAFMKSSSAAQSNLANVRDATMKDAGGKENVFLNTAVANVNGSLKGANAGMNFGGPWGALFGGITGGIAGGITGLFGSKKINRRRERAVNKYNKTYNANSIQQMYANAQANAADTVNRKQQLAAKANLVAEGGSLTTREANNYLSKIKRAYYDFMKTYNLSDSEEGREYSLDALNANGYDSFDDYNKDKYRNIDTTNEDELDYINYYATQEAQKQALKNREETARAYVEQAKAQEKQRRLQLIQAQYEYEQQLKDAWEKQKAEEAQMQEEILSGKRDMWDKSKVEQEQRQRKAIGGIINRIKNRYHE